MNATWRDSHRDRASEAERMEWARETWATVLTTDPNEWSWPLRDVPEHYIDALDAPYEPQVEGFGRIRQTSTYPAATRRLEHRAGRRTLRQRIAAALPRLDMGGLR